MEIEKQSDASSPERRGENLVELHDYMKRNHNESEQTAIYLSPSELNKPSRPRH